MGFCPQGAFLRQRLGDKGIGPVKAQLTAVEGRCHGLLIHQRAPGRVEQNGPGLHLRQRLRVDKASGLGRGRAVQAEDIAPPQQGIIIHELHTVGGVFGPDGAGADQHLHAKGSGNAGRLPPDAAIAVNAIGLAIELHLGQQANALRDIQLPASLLDGTVVALRALADGQQQAEGHLGHAVGRIARHIGHRNAVAAAGFQIQVVGARGDDAHPFQVRALL